MRRAAARSLPAALIVSFALSLMTLAPVAAAGVPGDESGEPIPIAVEDFGTPQAYDTTGATQNAATDPASCQTDFGLFEGPFTETVWHAFTPEADGPLAVDVNSFPDPEAPGFLAIVFVFEANGLTPVGCSAFPATVSFDAVAGTTYLAMTGSLPETPGGGPALITVAEPFLTDLTIDPDATYDPQTNEVTISGTFVCENANFVDMFAEARQEIGQHVVIGAGGTFVECLGGEQAWSITLSGFSSFLNPGALDVTVHASACSTFCTDASATATVRAHPTNNRPVPEEPPPPPPPPADNDELAAAFSIALGETAKQDASGATANVTDPQVCPFAGFPPSDHTVWYQFVAPTDLDVEVNTFGSDYDTTLYVLLGDEVIACNDDAQEVQSQAIFSATAGTTYDLMIGSFDGSDAGFLTLSVLESAVPPPPPPPPPGEPPPNDERADAIPLALGETLEADTSGATVNLETDPQACPSEGFPPSEHTAWYTVTADAAGWVEINTAGSEYDTTLYVLLGDEVLACNDEAPPGGLSQVTFLADAGVTYEVMAGSFDSSPGGALVISALPGTPPLEVTFSLDDTGLVNPDSGEATISGTIGCSEPAAGNLFVFVEQARGRFDAFGASSVEIECGPELTAWSVVVAAETSNFQTGDALVSADVSVSTEDGKGAGQAVQETVALQPAGSRR
jgi:hypothetical protein